jgi:hypothetical protein
MKGLPTFCTSLIFTLAVAGSLALPARPATAADFSVRLDIGGVAQLLFGSEPRMVMVPNTNTYYAQDVVSGDVYRVNNTWYTYYQNDWYRADSYRGTWTRSDFNGVPQELNTVPSGYRHFNHANRGGMQNGEGARPGYTRPDAARGYDPREEMWTRDAARIQTPVDPRMYRIPGSNISYALDHRNGELYRDGSNWYVSYGGNWYGSHASTGPWNHVETAAVPGGITSAPRGYYRSLGSRMTAPRGQRNSRQWRR